MVLPLVKLEIGAGEHPAEGGYLHNDVVAYPHIEIVADGAKLTTLRSDSVEIVRAMHVLEHMAPGGAMKALREWRRVLVPEGMLELALPNGEFITELWASGKLTYEAAIRDLLGLPPDEMHLPSEAEFAAQWLQYGWTPEFRDFLYGRTVRFLPCGKTANLHRWAYGPDELRGLLETMGYVRVVVRPEVTSLHAWAVKGKEEK